MNKPGVGIRLFLAATRAFTGEIRQLRQAVEQQTDSFRLAHGMPPLYADRGVEPPDRPAEPKGWTPRAGDHLVWWCLDELGAQFKIPIDQDLAEVAVERGWVDAKTGKFLMLPDTAFGELTGEVIRRLIGEG